ncbi:MAG TPA: 4'-phosphopantetheinyl transferase superfamily protein [Bryobacteraceae bacterium]|nr:4'-phosphopantetheinyl transferase superfamily protein [Bryobacteraceae bacterium]
MTDLAANEIHVYSISLKAAPDPSLLSSDEQIRAARFRYAEDRERYVAAHAGLRRVLSGYLGAPAGALQFFGGPHGKPYISGSRLQFNLSYSGDLALAAVCQTETGVDIERARSNFDVLRLASRFLSPAEDATLQLLPADERHEAFLRLWTRKEAALKALGCGLEGLSRDISGVHILDVALESGYLAAVAVLQPGTWLLKLCGGA